MLTEEKISFNSLIFFPQKSQTNSFNVHSGGIWITLLDKRFEKRVQYGLIPLPCIWNSWKMLIQMILFMTVLLPGVSALTVITVSVRSKNIKRYVSHHNNRYCLMNEMI